MTKGNKKGSSTGPPKTEGTFESGLRDRDLEAFEKLATKGVPRGYLNVVLSRIRRTSAKPISQFVKAMTTRQLLILPNRIISFAEEIERINSSPLLEDLIRTNDVCDFLIYLRQKSDYLDRVQEVFKNVPDWESNMAFSGEDFIRLPNLLRVYAILCLEPIISNVRKISYKLSGKKYLTIWLLEFVKACTDQYFQPEVARLLNAALRDPTALKADDEEFDAWTLAKLISNNPKAVESIRATPLLGKGLSPNDVRAMRRKKTWPLSY